MLPGEADRFIHGQQQSFFILHDNPIHELRQRGGGAHTGQHFVFVAAPAKIGAAIETLIDDVNTIAGDIFDVGAAIEHIEFNAAFIPPKPHRHEPRLLLKRAAGRRDRKRKSQFLHGACQRRLARQLAAKQDVHFHRHVITPRPRGCRHSHSENSGYSTT
jgi:hypothetical protein